jgi:hypothetical protein
MPGTLSLERYPALHLFGIDFSSFFQPLLALCGALALVLNTRNQDLSRLIRSGAEQVTRREDGKETLAPERRDFLRRQAILFRQRILIVQQALLFTYTAGISLTLMACFSKLPIPYHSNLMELCGALGVTALMVACISAVRDIARSTETIELEMVSAYGPEVIPHRPPLLSVLIVSGKRSFWIRFAEGCHAFANAFNDPMHDQQSIQPISREQ